MHKKDKRIQDKMSRDEKNIKQSIFIDMPYASL